MFLYIAHSAQQWFGIFEELSVLIIIMLLSLAFAFWFQTVEK